MTTAHYILAACGLAFLAAAAYAMWPAKSRALASIQIPGVRLRP